MFAAGWALAGLAAAMLQTLLAGTGIVTGNIDEARLVAQVQTVTPQSGERLRLTVRVVDLQIGGPDRRAATTGAKIQRLRLYVRDGPRQAPRPGDRIDADVALWPLPAPVAPGAYDYGRRLFFEGIGGFGRVVRWHGVETGGDSAAAWLARFRQGLSNHIRDTIGGEAGGIAAALVTGDRSGIPEETVAALRDTGLAHMLAISGLHMGLIAGFALVVVRVAIVAVPAASAHMPAKKLAAGVAMLAAGAYLVVSGASIPTIRAFVTVCIALLAVMVDRRAISLRTVALAAIVVLLLQPNALLEPGFQMSFAAATALVASFEIWSGWNRRRRLAGGDGVAAGRRTIAGRLLRGALAILVTSLIAGLATGPFAAFHFNRVASYGLAANVLALPFLGTVVMPSAVIAMVSAPFGLDAPFLAAMGWGLDQMLAIAHWIAAWPRALVTVPAAPFPVALLFVAGWLGLLLGPWPARLAGSGLIAGSLFAFPVNPLSLIVAPAQVTGTGPDILINDTSRLIAIRARDGRFAAIGAGSDTFSLQVWLRRDGDPRWSGNDRNPARVPEPQRTCDRLSCLVRGLGGRASATIAMPGHPAALSDDCRKATIVVVAWRHRGPCAAIMIDADARAAGGAHALTWANDRWRLETVGTWRGDRPWNAMSPPPVASPESWP